MTTNEDYQKLFYKEKVRCCGQLPRPLIAVKVSMDKRGREKHSSHYFDYAFECLECGAVYEVIMEDYSYECIGDFMMPNYISWSVRPSLHYLVNNPKHKKELKLLYDTLVGNLTVIDGKRYEAKKIINARIEKLEQTTGRLDKDQRERAEKRLCKPQILILQQYEKDKKEAMAPYIMKERELLGLDPISLQYRQKRLTNLTRLCELKEQLVVKKKKREETNKILYTIKSKKFLSQEITQIEEEILRLE